MQWTTWFAIAPGVICLICLGERLSLVKSNDGVVRGVLPSYLREARLNDLPRSGIASADHFGQRAGGKEIKG